MAQIGRLSVLANRLFFAFFSFQGVCRPDVSFPKSVQHEFAYSPASKICFSCQCVYLTASTERDYGFYCSASHINPYDLQFSFVILGPTGDHDCLFTTIKLLVVVVVLRQANQSRTKNQPTSRSEEDRWSHLVFLLGGTVVVRVLFLLSLSGQSLWTKQHTEAILVVRNLNQPNHYYPTHSSLPRS